MALNNKKSKKMKTQIHCPVPGCLFAVGSERHFTEKKFLNQHIAKVHAEKKYPCAKCNKSFGLDWWRKHHEKTCGMEWKCDCGLKYSSRESLLTHIRRTQHKVPDHVISSGKMKQNKPTAKSADSPVIVLIQPIIQNITCTQHHQTSVITPRRILPKATQPLFLTFPISMSHITPAPTPNSVSPVILSQTNENSFNSVQPLNSPGSPPVSPLPNQLLTHTKTLENLSKTNDKFQKTIATQTADDAGDIFAKHLQSQASQCSRRRPKSLKVGIENHTQTAESAVVKIKKKRSRRKSVAITTETSMLTDQMMINENNSIWPGFKDFVLQHADNLGTRLVKNSASTQTSMIDNKTLCDSETLTDQELFKLSWENAMKEVNKTDKCDADFQMITDMNSGNALPDRIDNSNLQDLNIFSDDPLHNFPENKTSSEQNSKSQSLPISLSEQFTSTVTNDCQINIDKNSDENCAVFSVFGTCDKSADSKVPLPPTLSDIHTQTIASAVLDYNLLTNMETQTTDDFNFSYLEFSDTETQTPWEDFPNMDDSPLQADQLSIEIQTDFSSFDAGLNMDFNEFINSVDVQNMMAGCSSKETAGINTETQTLDKFYFPQFTNSESQTLDMADFVFNS